MTAPITSNRPTTTRLHHYAGRHSHGSGIPVETFFAPAWGASTPVETFFAHAHPKWLIFDHFHLAGAIFLSQRHPKLPPGATQGRYFFHTAPRDDTESPPVCRAPRGMGPGRGAGGRWRGLAGHRDDAPSHTSATKRHWCGGRRRIRRDWLRCPWAVAGPGRASRWRTDQRSGPTGVEGAGGTRGPGCGARGRWRGLAGQRADAPSHTSATRPHWCGGRRRDRRARAGFEPTRRAKLAARTASGRAAAHGRTKQPGPAGTRLRQRGGYRSTRPLSAHSATASSRLRPNDPQSWRRRRIHRNMPPTTAAPRPAPPIRPSKPVRARPFFGLVAGTSGAT